MKKKMMTLAICHLPEFNTKRSTWEFINCLELPSKGRAVRRKSHHFRRLQVEEIRAILKRAGRDLVDLVLRVLI